MKTLNELEDMYKKILHEKIQLESNINNSMSANIFGQEIKDYRKFLSIVDQDKRKLDFKIRQLDIIAKEILFRREIDFKESINPSSFKVKEETKSD